MATLPPSRRRRRLGAALALSILVPGAGAAESAWYARAWQSDDGVPNQHVTALAQTQDGHVWVATMTGLARFDGSRFTRLSFQGMDGQGSRGDGVGGVLAAPDGALWISRLPGSVVRLSPDGGELSRVETGFPDTLLPLASVAEKDGAVWIGYAHSDVARIAKGKVTHFGAEEGIPAGGTIYSFALDEAGTVWMSKGSKVGYFEQGRFHECTAVNSKMTTWEKLRLAASKSGGVWVATRSGRLIKCTRTAILSESADALGDFPNATAVNALEDHSGAVWIGTDLAGVFRYDGSKFEKIDTSYPNITSLLETRDHAIWVGTAGGGLDRISPRAVALVNFGRPSFPVGARSVAEDTGGQLWAVTQMGKVVVRRGDLWTPQLGRDLGFATCIAAGPEGGVLIGTRDSHLHLVGDHEDKMWDRAQLGPGYISAVLYASDGDIWIGKSLGSPLVLRRHGDAWHEVRVPEGMDRVFAMTEDRDGRVWIGGRTGVLASSNGEKIEDYTARTGLSGWPIRCLSADSNGALWIAYGGAGLGRLKDGKFGLLKGDSGLPDTYLSQMVADDQGWFWFGGDRGIFKVRRSQLEDALDGHGGKLRPVFYGRNEGLLNLEGDYGAAHAALRSRDGRVWIPMRTALAVANPDALQEEAAPLKILLSEVAVDGQTVAAYDPAARPDAVNGLLAGEGPLRMGPGPRRLEIGFTAVEFQEPENVHFRYRMDGVDDDWIDAGSLRSAAYTHLTAGRYHFHVQASVGDGAWSEAPVPLSLTVAPFFWQTLWFRLAVLGLFTSSGAAIARYWSHRRLREQVRRLEQQTALDKERTRIARDLHDDLGGSLTQVALMMDRAQGDAPAEQRTTLGRCSSMVRQVAKSVDEIIWAINPRNDTLPYLVDYLGQFVVEFLHAADIRCRVDIPDRLPERTVSPEMRHHIFLAVKESLHNIARHAGASEVRLRIAADEKGISILVEDDGCGFEAAPENATADGLRNMRQRMSEIGGRLEIDSKKGEGTRISLVYAWTPAA